MNEILRFHLIGIPEAQAGDDQPNNPFNTKLLYLAKILKNILGHEVVHYGVEGSQVDCHEHVDTVKLSTYREQFKDRSADKVNHWNESTGPVWDEMHANLEREIRKRIKNPGRDFLVNFIGSPFAYL
jgi:hypothetical protein